MIKSILKNISIKFIFVIIGAAVSWFLTFTACKSLKVYDLKNWPKKCNVMFTAMDFEKGSKSSAISSNAFVECSKALDIEYCTKKVYGNNTIDFDDLKNKDFYNQCLKERR